MLGVDIMCNDDVFSVSLIYQQLQRAHPLTIAWHVQNWVHLIPGAFPTEQIKFIDAAQLGDFQQLVVDVNGHCKDFIVNLWIEATVLSD